MNQYGVTYSTSSDYRLKRNIVPIADSIDRIKKLNLVDLTGTMGLTIML
jgi:hypothetical protein